MRVYRRSRGLTLQSAFFLMLRHRNLPEPQTEYLFAAPDRKYRADFCWPDRKLIVEVEGYVYGSGKKKCPLCGRADVGGHSSVSGILRDIDKYNLATMLGFSVLRFTPQQILEGDAVETIKKFLLGD